MPEYFTIDPPDTSDDAVYVAFHGFRAVDRHLKDLNANLAELIDAVLGRHPYNA